MEWLLHDTWNDLNTFVETWNGFVATLKTYYLVGNYDDQYIKLSQLCWGQDQFV